MITGNHLQDNSFMAPAKPSDCCKDSANSVFFYSGAWRFECDDGRQGIEIAYCPFCGEKLNE